MSTGLLLTDVVLRHDGTPGRTLTAPPGSIVALVGPSGGDRARLLLAIASLDQPVSGRITFDGEPVHTGDAGSMDEDHSLIGGLSAAENIAVRVLARHELTEADWSGVTRMLGDLGLPESSWHNLVEQLSGGQQQRVALARALIDSPALICLDDPTSELDPASAELVWQRLDEAAGRGAVVIVGLPGLEPPAHADIVITAGT